MIDMKGLPTRQTVLMDGPGHQFLAGAAVPEDEHVDVLGAIRPIVLHISCMTALWPIIRSASGAKTLRDGEGEASSFSSALGR